MKSKINIGIAMALAVACSVLFAADVDKFLKASDGEVIGTLALGKQKLSLTGTVKEVTWMATNGQAITIRWDGKTLLQDEKTLKPFVDWMVSSGEFCRLRGHAWGAHMHLTLEYVPSRIGCRECKVCGLHQSQYATEWK